jgi:hypothetical protein
VSEKNLTLLIPLLTRIEVGVSILMAVPAIVAAFQVKRLQRWWEEGQAWWRVKQQEQQENQSKETQFKESTT